jgi:hypothetical protein
MVPSFKAKKKIFSQEVFPMCRRLRERGYPPASCRPLNTCFIMQEKLSRQWGDIDNGVLQARLHRLTPV